jgi:3-methyl-2-oxobutanoate hydroxymethyltransferase
MIKASMLQSSRRLFSTTSLLKSSYPLPSFPSSQDTSSPQRKISINDIRKLYESKTPIAVLTAHDFITGRYADESQADVVLVGDSLAMTALGYEDTNEIPFDEFLYHCKAVSRGVKRAFTVADLTFGSYESSVEKAIESSIALIKKGRVNAIKLEGGVEICPTIEKLTSLGLPVMGHVGLTPQRSNALGGFKVQGKSVLDALKILRDAKAVEEAGAFAIVLEAIPSKIAQIITDQLNIPTIGIGAGNGTNGQVLVQADLLGMNPGKVPKFVKQYGNIYQESVKGASQYVNDVKNNGFPGVGKGYEYKVKEEVVEEFIRLLQQS